MMSERNYLAELESLRDSTSFAPSSSAPPTQVAENKESSSKQGAFSTFLTYLRRSFEGLLGLTITFGISTLFFSRLILYINQEYLSPTMSFWVGGGLGIFLLMGLGYVIKVYITRSWKVPFFFMALIWCVGSSFVLYSGFSFKSNNAKSSKVVQTWNELHPALRVATTTLIFLDRSLIITDSKRFAEEYKAMGLPLNTSSLHFPQSDGFVHALDIRTIGRPEWQNFAIERMYALMGFRTLRHTGTADHLHISIPKKE